jgi:hypothetical protein
MATQVFDGNVVFKNGTISFQNATLSPPPGSVGNAAVSAAVGDRIDADKLIHKFSARYSQPNDIDVTAESATIHVAHAAGQIDAVRYAVTGAAPTGDRVVSLDLKRSSGGGSYSSILASSMIINSASTANSALLASISNASYVANDIFEVQASLAGSSGTQAQGVIVDVLFREP